MGISPDLRNIKLRTKILGREIIRLTFDTIVKTHFKKICGKEVFVVQVSAEFSVFDSSYTTSNACMCNFSNFNCDFNQKNLDLVQNVRNSPANTLHASKKACNSEVVTSCEYIP